MGQFCRVTVTIKVEAAAAAAAAAVDDVDEDDEDGCFFLSGIAVIDSASASAAASFMSWNEPTAAVPSI